MHDGSATPEQNAEHGALTARLRRFPSSGDPLPTRTGNILCAAETRPTDKYGLDAVAVWPHLWLLLPDTTRKDIATARLSLDASTAACVWGLAFTAFAPWTLWAVPVGLTVAVASLAGWVPERAETYADLVEASFGLHRGALYGQLRWPLPGNPRDERVQGRRVTTYLVLGLSGSTPPLTGGAHRGRPRRRPRSGQVTAGRGATRCQPRRWTRARYSSTAPWGCGHRRC